MGPITLSCDKALGLVTKCSICGLQAPWLPNSHKDTGGGQRTFDLTPSYCMMGSRLLRTYGRLKCSKDDFLFFLLSCSSKCDVFQHRLEQNDQRGNFQTKALMQAAEQQM